MNEDKLKIAIINFMWIAHYNGYLEEVNDIYEALKNPAHCIQRPDKWREKDNYGVDEFEGVFLELACNDVWRLRNFPKIWVD